MNPLPRQWLVYLLALSCLALAACGQDGPTEPEPPPPEIPVPTRVAITPSSVTLDTAGQTVKLTAMVFDQHGAVLGGATVNWSTSHPAVATVSDQGLVTAVMNGTAQISARAGNASASVTVTVAVATPDPGRDRAALAAFYASTGGAEWTVSTNWLSDEPLASWHGVSTGSDGRVTELSLQENNLNGTIPPELGNLGNLRRLWLSNNGLTGTIPAKLGQLGNLESLVLDGNGLTGSIPPELGRLGRLSTLSLFNNQLSGAIPPELGELRNLFYLNLILNQLTGPVPPQLGELEKLSWLDFGSNTGLTGPLPTTFLQLELRHFSTFNTGLCVPSAFRLWLDKIPSARISGYCRDPERDPLIALYNHAGGAGWTVSTNWLSEKPLCEWHGVSTDGNGRVTAVDLNSNNLIGSVPGQAGELAGLKALDLSGNEGLTGVLPQSFIELELESLALGGSRVCVPPLPAYRQWLDRIPLVDVTACSDSRPDYYALAALYNSTNGPGWTNSANWLSGEPLGAWHGVSEDPEGRVAGLDLDRNNLQGSIPVELAQLENLTVLRLGMNQLSGPIPVEIAQLQDLTELRLRGNRLTGPIPPEIAQLRELTALRLSVNRLDGSIPPEIAQLRNLEILNLASNSLTGNIPPEIAQLGKLRVLIFHRNELTGPIPPEISQLRNLEELFLGNNGLTGAIPPEIGQLEELLFLHLDGNALEGVIPSEIGNLAKLGYLRLDGNGLTGAIPPETGRLGILREMNLSDNGLEGVIPPEIGRLGILRELDLSGNALSGNVPASFGDLASLVSLNLTGNTGMSGMLPPELTGLDLENLLLGGTGLCAPAAPDFQDWLRAVLNSRVANCAVAGRSAAYLTQATQSLTHPVPLVAGEEALLRVFITHQGTEEPAMPPVRATFHLDGSEVHSVDIPGSGLSVPREIDESDLAASANATVPGSVVAPGLELAIEIDPEGTLDPSLGIGGRLPPTGRMSVEVQEVPPLHLTLVPYLWTESPDRSVLAVVEGLTAESDLFRLTRDLLPVGEFRLDVREPVWVSFNPVDRNTGSVISQTQMIRTMDGARGHYMGILNSGGGIARRPGYVSAAILQGTTIAHELGHNFSLYHTPCGGGANPDPEYPYPGGAIGAWGYDLLEERLVSPDTPDLMGYCHPNWISDYNFTKALRYRVSQAPPTAAAFAARTGSLLLWGGVDEDGELVLEPAFMVDAPTAAPRLNGPYTIVGEDRAGGVLFRFSFGMGEFTEDVGGAFAFILPVRADWSRRLARVTLSGPEGVAEITGDGNRTAVLMLDPVTDRVRGVLRGRPGPDEAAGAYRRVLPEQGLKVLTSRGLPDSAGRDR